MRACVLEGPTGRIKRMVVDDFEMINLNFHRMNLFYEVFYRKTVNLFPTVSTKM